MDSNATSLQRQRIPNDKRKECLKLFEQGYGYKKTAQLAGLNTYTVREYKRRFAQGDNTWAGRQYLGREGEREGFPDEVG